MEPAFKLSLTEEDVRKASRFKVNNPILYALQRTTATLWRMYDDGLLVEVMEPFRAYQLPTGALNQYTAYEATGHLAPFECELEPLVSASPSSNFSAAGSASVWHQRPCPRRLREAARADGGW